jgi:hypothetical protein
MAGQRWTDSAIRRIQAAVRAIERQIKNAAGHRGRGYPPPTQERWGKLDGTLSAGGSATVSLWEGTGGSWGEWDQDSGENWEDVYAPPAMASGTIASGTWVLVRVVNGRRVVMNAWTHETVMTDFQVDTSTKKLQMKTRALLVVAVGAESGWTDIHTGTVCP